MKTVMKIVAVTLATGAFATLGATGSAFAHWGGGHYGGYGYHYYPHFYGYSIGYSPCYWVTRPEGLVKVCPSVY